MLKTVSAVATSVIAAITGGLVRFTGPSAGQTRTITVPDANATMARTDAAQSFTGNQTLADGNLVIGTLGKGIDFSATPNPGGMTSELLSDYEEGTWTPTFNRGSTQPTVTYSNQSGSYTKIGRQVIAVFDVSASSISGGAGDAIIGGLPFVKGSFPSMSIVYRDASAVPAGAAGTQIGAYNNSGDAILYLQYENSGAAGYGTAGSVAGWNASGRINGWVVYFV